MHRKYAITGPGPPPDPGGEARQRSPASEGHVTTSSRDYLAVDLSPSARDVRSKIPVRSQSRSETTDNHTNNRFGMKSRPRCTSAAELYTGTKIPITPRMSRSGRTIGGTSGVYKPEMTPCFDVKTPHSVISPKVTSTARSSRLPVATGNRSKATSLWKKKSSSSVVPSKSEVPLRDQWKGTKIPVRVLKPVAKVGDSYTDVNKVEAVNSNVEVEVSSIDDEEDFDIKVVESEAVEHNVEVEGFSIDDEEDSDIKVVESEAVEHNVEVEVSSHDDEDDSDKKVVESEAVDSNEEVEVASIDAEEDSDKKVVESEDIDVDANVEVEVSSHDDEVNSDKKVVESEAVDSNEEVEVASIDEEEDTAIKVVESKDIAVDANVEVEVPSIDDEEDSDIKVVESEAVDSNVEVEVSSHDDEDDSDINVVESEAVEHNVEVEVSSIVDEENSDIQFVESEAVERNVDVDVSSIDDEEDSDIKVVESKAVEHNVEVEVSSIDDEEDSNIKVVESEAVESNAEVDVSSIDDEEDSDIKVVESEAVESNVEVEEPSFDDKEDSDIKLVESEAVEHNVEVSSIDDEEDSDIKVIGSKAVEPNVEVEEYIKDDKEDSDIKVVESDAVVHNVEVEVPSIDDENDSDIKVVESEAVERNVDVDVSSIDDEENSDIKVVESEAVEHNVEVEVSGKNDEEDSDVKVVESKAVEPNVEVEEYIKDDKEDSDIKVVESAAVEHNVDVEVSSIDDEEDSDINVVESEDKAVDANDEVEVSSIDDEKDSDIKVVESEAVEHNVEVEVSSIDDEEDSDIKVVESKAVDSNVEVEVSSKDDEDKDVLVKTVVDIPKMNVEVMDIQQASSEQNLAFQDQIISKEIELKEKLRNLDKILEVMLEKRAKVDRLATEVREVYVAIDNKDPIEGVYEFSQEIETFHNICFETEVAENKFSSFPRNNIAKANEEHKIAEEVSAEELNSLLEKIRDADESEIVPLTESFVMGSMTKHGGCDVIELNSSIDAIMDKYKLSEPNVDDNAKLIQRVAKPVSGVNGDFNLDIYDTFRDDTKYVPALDALGEEGEEDVDENIQITHDNTVADNTEITHTYNVNTTPGDNATDSVQTVLGVTNGESIEVLQTDDNDDTKNINRENVTMPSSCVVEHLDISEDLHEMRRELMNKYATIDTKENGPKNEMDDIEHELNLMHAWNEYSDLGDEDEIGNLLEAIQCMKRHVELGNTNVQQTIDTMVDTFIVGGDDVECIDDFEQPVKETNTTYPRGNDDYEKPGEDTNPKDPRGNDDYEKPGKDLNPKVSRGNNDYEKPIEGINPTDLRGNGDYKEPGEATNITDPKGNDDYEKPGEDTNPTDSTGNDDYEKPGKDTNPTDSRGNDEYEKPGVNTNPTDQRGNDDYEKPGEDINPTDQRGNRDYEKPGEDTNPTDPRGNDDYEKPGEDTNPTDSRGNDEYEKPGEDTNPAYPRGNDDYEKPGEDTNPTDQRGNDDYEKPGEDTNPTDPRGNRDYEKPGEDKKLYPRCNDDFEKLGEDINTTIDDDDEIHALKEERLAIEQEFVRNRKRHETDINNIRRFWKNTARFVFEDVKTILLEATCTSDDVEPIQCHNMDDLMQIVLKAISSNALEVINDICETHKDKPNEDLMNELFEGLKQHKMNIKACHTEENKELENIDMAVGILEEELDIDEVDTDSCQSEMSVCSIERLFQNDYEFNKSPTKEIETHVSNRARSVKCEEEINNEDDLNKDLTCCDSLEYMGSSSPCSLEIEKLTNTSMHTVDTRFGKDQMMSEWMDNSDLFMKCEKLNLPIVSPSKHESGYTAKYEDNDSIKSPSKHESGYTAKYEDNDSIKSPSIHESGYTAGYDDYDKQGFQHENVDTNTEVKTKCQITESFSKPLTYCRLSAILTPEYNKTDSVTNAIHINNDTVNVGTTKTVIRPDSPLRGPEVKGIFKNINTAKQRNTGETRKTTWSTERKPAIKTEIKIDFAGLRIDGTNINDAKPSKNKTPRSKISSGAIKLITKGGLPNIRHSKKHSTMVEKTKREILDVFTPNQKVPTRRLGLDVDSYGTTSLNPHQVLPSITPANGRTRNINQASSFTTNHGQTPSVDFLATPLPAIKSKHHRKYGK